MNIIIKIIGAFLQRFDNFAWKVKTESVKNQLQYCGSNVGLGREVMIIRPHLVSIGEYTQIGERCYIRGGGRVTIGKYCQIANNVIIVTTNHNINGQLYFNNTTTSNVRIGNNVWVACGAKIMPNVEVGDNSVIAAGAVVTRNVPENVVVGGVPARIIKKIKMKYEDENIS